MADLLAEAFAEASKLPEKERNALARQILQVLSERNKREGRDDDGMTLDELLEEARRDQAEGRTYSIGAVICV